MVVAVQDPGMLERTPSPPARARLKTVEIDGRYRDLIKIETDTNLTSAEANAIADQIGKAYVFDLKNQGLLGAGGQPKGVFAKQLIIHVLSPARFYNIGGTASGITLGKDLVAVPSTLVKDGKVMGGDADTLGHELSHVIEARSGKRRARWIPMFLQEGQAYIQGGLYLNSIESTAGVDKERYNIHDELGKLTGAQAVSILKRLRTGADEDRMRDLHAGETTGALFMEFLRLKIMLPEERSRPDAMKRLGRVIREVGEGARFSPTFEREFGMTMDRALDAFRRFLDDTQHHPGLRLRGTIWEETRWMHAHRPS